ncbi:MAG: HlyD family secretion protein [Alphaproteobacteria bacterium]
MKKLRLLFCLLAASCQSEETNTYNGYIEGEYVYVSAYTGGILDRIDVVKGQLVDPGTGLFRLDEEIWAADLARAQSVLDKAYANLSNLSKGKRRQELDVILKQKAQAQAVLDNARKEFMRAEELIKTRNISRSDYDKKRSDYENARAKTEELEASFQTATLAAREDELTAARKEIEAAVQDLKKIQKQAANNAAVSPVAGRVQDVYFRRGEFVPAGTPVVSVLPPENVKARFYVPENVFSQIKPEAKVSVFCDACPPAGIAASVSFISTQSEFTPPVIYSVESREKLVFMIEAVFDDKTLNLPPGLPVNVRIKQNERAGD